MYIKFSSGSSVGCRLFEVTNAGYFQTLKFNSWDFEESGSQVLVSRKHSDASLWAVEHALPDVSWVSKFIVAKGIRNIQRVINLRNWKSALRTIGYLSWCSFFEIIWYRDYQRLRFEFRGMKRNFQIIFSDTHFDRFSFYLRVEMRQSWYGTCQVPFNQKYLTVELKINF